MSARRVKSHLYISSEPEDRRAYAVAKAEQEARDRQSDAERLGVQPALPGLSMADETRAKQRPRACKGCGAGFFGFSDYCRPCYQSASPAFQGAAHGQHGLRGVGDAPTGRSAPQGLHSSEPTPRGRKGR